MVKLPKQEPIPEMKIESSGRHAFAVTFHTRDLTITERYDGGTVTLEFQTETNEENFSLAQSLRACVVSKETITAAVLSFSYSGRACRFGYSLLPNSRLQISIEIEQPNLYNPPRLVFDGRGWYPR
jgi:hypothetical protein